MKQIVIIHGGDSFSTNDAYLSYLKNFKIESVDYFKRHKGWKDTLETELGANIEVLTPRMPNANNAKYEEWKIWFEKLIPFLTDGVLLVGHSLGGIFLVKYLSENHLPVHIDGVFLVAAPYGADTDECGEFVAPTSLSLLTEQAKRIFLYQSEDDPIVPFTELEKYRRALPNAEARIFKNRGHFNQETFPEIITDLKNS